MPGPSLPTPISDFMTGKITIDGPDCRWTENYHFTNNASESKTRLGIIIDARRRLLARGFSISDGVVSQQIVKFDSYPVWPASGQPVQCTTDTAGPPLVIEACNDSTVGIFVRFQAQVGRVDRRCITGVRDTFITNNWFSFTAAYSSTYALNTYIGGTYPPTYASAPGDTPTALVHNFLSIVRDKTVLISPVPNVSGSFYAFDFLSYALEAVKHRQRGVVTRIPRGRQRSWS